MKGLCSMGILPFLFSLFFELAVCPVLGQTNNGIRAHLQDDRLYLEVSTDILDQPFLFVRHEIGYQQVVWTKMGNHLILKVMRVKSLSGIIIPVNQEFKIDALVLGRFPIIKHNKATHYLYIDATHLFLSTEIKWYKDFVEEAQVPGQAFFEKVGYLEGETIIQTQRTVSRDGNWKTVVADFSFFRLIEPMKPRLFDSRMGFFIEDKKEGSTNLGCITRWRLEKKFKNRFSSDPLRPITFYFDPKLPDKWKPYVKAGILEWLPTFEAAGFTNAIEVKNLPLDTTAFFRNSMTHSMIRWNSYTGIRGAEERSGSTVDAYVDFRTGEILKADIILASSYQSLMDDYFVRCAPMDERSWQYPFPDNLLGELIQAVTAHEAGHAFGLRDGNYGEFGYPFKKMRDADWLRKMGHTPSAMTYARHNHIAQPEDSIPPSLLVQKVGPMDVYQIQWGYTPINGAYSPNEELTQLNRWITIQDTVPWYRFNPGYYKSIGPGTVNEVVDNNDPIQSTLLGLKNIRRVLDLIPYVNRDQHDNALVVRLYLKTLELWYHEMTFVMSLIGGYDIQYKSGQQKGNVYEPIGLDRQLQAMAFLVANAFEVPIWLANPEFSNRIQYTTNDDNLLEKQLILLSEIVEPFRMKRLEQMEKVSESGISKRLFEQLRNGLFGELKGNPIKVDQRRQKLQRAYVKLLVNAIGEERRYDRPNAIENTYLYSDFSKSIFLSELVKLQKEIDKASKRVKEETTKGHLMLCLQEIEKVVL